MTTTTDRVALILMDYAARARLISAPRCTSERINVSWTGASILHL